MKVKVSTITKRKWSNKKGNGYSYFFTYIDLTGALKTSGGHKTKAVAEIERARIINELETGAYINIDKTILFKDLSQIYMKDFAQVYFKPSTCDGYENYLRNHIWPFFGNMRAFEIIPMKINEFIRIKKQTSKLSNQSINKLICLMNTIYTYAIDNEIVSKNPVRVIKKLDEKRKEPNPLTLKEVGIILNVAKKYEPDFYPLLFTAVATGARRGELLALTWDRVNFVEKYIFVDKSVYKNKFNTPKTKTSIRKIDLPDDVIKVLKEWRLKCPNGELNLVFPNEEGHFQDHKNMKNRKYHAVLRRAGVGHRTFHDLRHTYATLLAINETNPQYVQMQLGHAKISTTLDIYTKVTQETRQKGIMSLNKVFSLSEQSNDAKRFGT